MAWEGLVTRDCFYERWCNDIPRHAPHRLSREQIVFSVMNAHPVQYVFKGPNGRKIGLLYLSLAFLVLIAHLYFAVLLDGPRHMLFLGVAFALSGVAESLPQDRRRMAGVLRITAIGVAVILLLLIFFNPEFVLGE